MPGPAVVIPAPERRPSRALEALQLASGTYLGVRGLQQQKAELAESQRAAQEVEEIHKEAGLALLRRDRLDAWKLMMENNPEMQGPLGLAFVQSAYGQDLLGVSPEWLQQHGWNEKSRAALLKQTEVESKIADAKYRTVLKDELAESLKSGGEQSPAIKVLNFLLGEGRHFGSYSDLRADIRSRELTGEVTPATLGRRAGAEERAKLQAQAEFPEVGRREAQPTQWSVISDLYKGGKITEEQLIDRALASESPFQEALATALARIQAQIATGDLSPKLQRAYNTAERKYAAALVGTDPRIDRVRRDQARTLFEEEIKAIEEKAAAETAGLQDVTTEQIDAEIERRKRSQK